MVVPVISKYAYLGFACHEFQAWLSTALQPVQTPLMLVTLPSLPGPQERTAPDRHEHAIGPQPPTQHIQAAGASLNPAAT